MRHVRGISKALLLLPLLELGCALLDASWAAEPRHLNKQRPIELTTTGKVEPSIGRVRLGSAINGIIEAVRVQEGDRVEAGQILIELDCRVILQELRAYQAESIVAFANLRRLKRGPRDEEVAIANAAIRYALVRLEEAEATYKRMEILKERNAVSVVSINSAKRDVLTATAQLDEARERLSLLQAGPRQEDVAEAQGRLAQSIANVHRASYRLDQCKIRAPISGVVLSTEASVGQLVGEMNPIVIVLADDQHLQIRSEIDEGSLPRVCVGQGGTIRSVGYPDDQLRARLVRLSPTMGRRGQHGEEGGEPEIREFILAAEQKIRWPIGTRVSIDLDPCEVGPAISRSEEPDATGNVAQAHTIATGTNMIATPVDLTADGWDRNGNSVVIDRNTISLPPAEPTRSIWPYVGRSTAVIPGETWVFEVWLSGPEGHPLQTIVVEDNGNAWDISTENSKPVTAQPQLYRIEHTVRGSASTLASFQIQNIGSGAINVNVHHAQLYRKTAFTASTPTLQ
jgi:HlyD family secretion protein